MRNQQADSEAKDRTTITSPQRNGLSIGKTQFMRKMDTALIVSLATVGEKSCFRMG